MWQFLQTYGIWILFAIFFVLMIRMHMGGMGGMHGGGGMNMNRSSREPSDTPQAVPLDESQHGAVVRDISPDGKIVTPNGSSERHHSHC